MAKQDGILKLKGTIGDITFYKSRDGHMARQKGGIEASRIANDPSFQRTRENGEEFRASASAGKMIRDALRPMLMNTADSRMSSRLMKLMSLVKNLDTTSVRGKRNVALAISAPIAKALLKGFEFNDNTSLSAVLFTPYNVQTATGVIKIPSLIPKTHVKSPPGSTHVAIQGAWLRIDFATGVAQLEQTNVVNAVLDATPSTIALTPTAAPAGPGTDIFLLQLEFFQMVNGLQYSLNNGAFNVLSIIEVA